MAAKIRPFGSAAVADNNNNKEQAFVIRKEAEDALTGLREGRLTLNKEWVTRCLEVVASFATNVIREPGAQRTLEEVKSIARSVDERTIHMEETLTLVKNRPIQKTPVAAPVGSTPRSYASVAAVPGAITAGATSQGGMLLPNHIAAIQHRHFIIKMGDKAQSDANKKTDPQLLASKVNQSLKTLKITNKDIGAVKVLPCTGDIQIITVNEEEADKLRRHMEWVKSLGKHASEKRPTYGILVKGVKTEEIKTDNLSKAMDYIKSCNETDIPHMDIRWMGYLHKLKEGEKVAPLVLDLFDEEQADRCISRGIFIGQSYYKCEFYNKHCRSQQCFKCWQYGHYSTSCPKNADTCGKCSGEHIHKECSQSTPLRCAVCKGAHTAWSVACEAKKKDRRRMEEARRNTPVFHGSSQLGKSFNTAASYTGTTRGQTRRTIYQKPGGMAGPSIQTKGPNNGLATREGINGARTPLDKRPKTQLRPTTGHQEHIPGGQDTNYTGATTRSRTNSTVRSPSLLWEVSSNMPRSVSTGNNKKQRTCSEGDENQPPRDDENEEASDIDMMEHTASAPGW